MTVIMKRIVFLTLLFPVIGHSIFVDYIRNFINLYKTSAVTQFSCDKKESFHVLKQLTEQKTLIRILKIDPSQLGHSAPQNTQLFVLNLECENSIKLLKKANDLKYFTFPYKWIFFHTTPLDTVLEKYFQHLDILVDSEVTICHLQEEEDSVSFQKIFKYRSGHPIQIETAGYWNKDEGYNDLGLEKNVARRRNDLKGITLNTCIVVTHNDTLNHLTDKRDKHIDSITKVNYVLVEHLGNIVNGKLNFSVQSTWGYKINNSDWNGMIGHLIRKQADIGGTPLFFTVDRVDIIDYIAMTTPTRSKFIFREPKLSYVTNVFTLPFDRQVWASTIALVIITGLFVYFIMKWEFKKKQLIPKKDSSAPDVKTTLTEVALFSFGAFCQQGSPTIPTSVPGRITTIILFVSLMFLYTSYSANIVALLQSSSSSIQTLEDLLKSRLEVGVDDTVFNRFYFPNSKEPIRKALYEQKVAPPGRKNQFMSLAEGVSNIREGLFAFHMETGVGYKLVGEIFHESEKCGLKEIQFLEVIDPWLAIQKNSSYKKLFQIGLRKIQESGIQTREVSAIYTKKPICISRGSSFISVGLVDCYPAAVVLVAGIAASLIIWMFEVMAHNRWELKHKLANLNTRLNTRRTLN